MKQNWNTDQEETEIEYVYEEDDDDTSEDEASLEWEIDETAAGERLDKFVAEAMDDDAVSRTQVQDWIKDGAVLVNGSVAKPKHRLVAGDLVAVHVPEAQPTEIVAEPIPLEVVYEDSDVIVINKQRGLVVHPAPGHSSGTVVNALLYHCKDLSGINGSIRPGIVHRIDKDTSGLLMAAKNDTAHASLSEQLKAHTVTRKYIALVHGKVPHERGTIDAPIGRDERDRKMFTVTEKNSRHAVTHFNVIERLGEDYTLLELQLETGRTHQIRVHMKYIGHPLAGDPMYGRSKTVDLKGQALHAAILGFEHPRTGEFLQFEAPIPADMEHVLHSLRQR
ncbi:RluA family pseudouridine synthase [Paenibacillus cellulosilyticus]|uniref:Pseudouridine synthase n=1 Tax=Paenibacillus cellulosilyticus TaxID=375489 RepID=A0A2V2YL95_9BACL|nr:RluA family pseudouridine synthase [Paenibacillus cellulosilyticus]PWV89386.1 RluA family pseudouridine synthase [Paenibacillus cellulosilyticus]QKS43137.1 RluA family pseudouridine synthase [Paenibacillus cellulosilyticus]